MKKIFIAFLLALAASLIAPQVKAYEGSVDMSKDQISCRASSVWREDHYEVIGKCDGLVYPYQTKLEHYYAWAHEVERDGYVRIGEVDRGYFEGSVAGDFDRIMISAEEDSGPRRPSDISVIVGNLDRYNFERSELSEDVVTTETTVTESVQDKVVDTVSTATEDSESVGSVVGRILITILAIIVVVIVIVIVGSLIFRRRGSVSG